MMNDERNPKPECRTARWVCDRRIRHSDFAIPSVFIIRIWKRRFKESPLSLVHMHWDYEPTPSPSQEGSRTASPGPLLGEGQG